MKIKIAELKSTILAIQHICEMRMMEIFKTYIKSPEFKQIIRDIVREGRTRQEQAKAYREQSLKQTQEPNK